MVRWHEFEAAAPEIAAAGKALFTQFGPGLAFMATVRPDGGPRLHPICVCPAEGGLYAWILRASPKRKDLARDNRVALHSFPPAKTDDEFYITGAARPVHDPELEARVKAIHTATGATVGDEEDFIEFDIENVLLAIYETRPQWPPKYEKWSAR